MSPKQIDILNNAIEFEQEGKDYYAKAMGKTSHGQARAMFRTLMEQEDSHIKILREIHASLSKEGKWPARTTLALQQLDFKRLFTEAKKKMGDTLDIATDELEVLKLAMELEARGKTMYAEAAAQAKDANEKSLYERLAQEEGKHYDFIDSHYAYFVDKGLRMNE
jgi:rubrerythrin